MEQRGSVKRPAEGEPQDAPSAKRARTGEAPSVSIPPLFEGFFGSMDDLDIHTLKLQNRELLAKTRQLKIEVDRVTDAQKKAEEAELKAQKNVMAMASCWDQLVSDLAAISDHLGTNSVDSTAVDSEFYSALLNSSANATGSEGAELMAKYSDLCKRGLSSLVAALVSRRTESQKIIQLVSSGSADQALQAEIAVLKQERVSLMKQNDDLLAKDRQRKRVEQELRREAEAARAAEKVATENAKDVKATLAERLHQLGRLSQEYERLQNASKEALKYKEDKEAEEAAKSEEAKATAANGNSHQQEGNAGPADPALRAELEETKTKLTKAETEIASLREAKKQMINEVEDMRKRLYESKITAEDWARHPDHLSLRNSLESHAAELTTLRRDADHWKRIGYDASAGRDQHLQRENDRLRDDISHLRSQAEERTRALKQLEQDREKLKFELDQSRTHQHSAETVRTMLDSIKRLTEDRNRAAQDYENARREVQKLQADVQRLSTSDAKSLHLMIENLESQVADLKASEAHLKMELAKQEPVINAYKMGKTPQANELVDLSARVQVLQDENAKLRAAAAASPAAVPSDVGQLQLELEQSRRKVASLEKQLAYYVSELDAIMPAYEELNATNEKLLHQIVQGEEASMSIKADSRRNDSAQQALQKENQILTERIRVLEQKIANQSDLYRQEIKKNQLLAESTAQSDVQSKHLQNALDEQKTANKQLVMAQDLLIARIQELNAQYNQIVADTKKFRVEAEEARSAISKLEDERSTLNTKLNRSQRIGLSGSGTVDARLKEELELYKNYYYCSVCRVNRNDTVLSQCGHITCRDCVEKNVKSRSRKCPACSQSFATGDIVSVFYFS
eukprot:TRINITY_DN5621_c0_g5_i1.p1 TRINITY_DN5621_c0_g5~~TRINITY_DN5621_c0_g5_i1.p1  ORF type:complete len:858 (-),score=245.68 TRINITY_DN5621_c0_g5_i1:30-2603(-)